MAFLLGSRLATNRPLTEYLRAAVAYFHTIELPMDPIFFTPHFAFTTPQKKVLQVYRQRYHFELTMHAPFTTINLGSVDPEFRRLSVNISRTVLRAAAELGIRCVTFHPCPPDPEHNYSECCRWEAESISLLLQEAKATNTLLLIENMPKDPRFHPATTDGSRLQELLWQFPEAEFGITVDVGHALQANVAVAGLLKLDRVRHFHLHENDRRGDNHRPIMENIEWWQRLLRRLMKNFPRACGILEMNDLSEQTLSLRYLNRNVKRLISRHPRRPGMIPPLFD